MVDDRTQPGEDTRPFYLKNVPQKSHAQQVKDLVRIAREGRQNSTAPAPKTQHRRTS